MFQKDSALRRTFVHAGVDLRSGHLWDKPSGLWKKRTTDQLFVPRWGIGNSPVDHTTGYTGERLNGPPIGRLRKLLQAAGQRKSGGMLTMKLSTINMEDS